MPDLRPNLPGVALYFQDGNLGLAPPSGASIHAKIGVSSKGQGVLTPVSTVPGVLDAFGGGPLASALAHAVVEASPVYGFGVAADVPGTLSAVAKTGTGTSVVTVAGNPDDGHTVRVEITRPAASIGSGAGAMRVIVDGNTDVPEVAVPASGTYTLGGTGITLTFGAGTLAVGDVHTFTSTPPRLTVGALIPAIQAALADGRPFRFLHVVGASTPTVAAAIDTVLGEQENRARYTRVVLQARGQADNETEAAFMAALNTEWSGYVSPRGRVAVAAGDREVFNPITLRMERRNAAWDFTARRATRPLSESPTRVRTGPLRAGGRVFHDEYAAPGLTVARFITLRTFPGVPGVFVAEAPTMAAPASDFSRFERGETLDEAARLAYIFALIYTGDSLAVDATTGAIAAAQADGFEAYVRNSVLAQMSGDVSGVQVTVDRTTNLLATETVYFDLGVIPLGYSKYIVGRIGFVNPMLAAQTATAAPTDPTAGATGTGPA